MKYTGEDIKKIQRLFKNLFRVEAKYPSAFRFEPEEVVRTFGDDNPALRAATDPVRSAAV